MPSHSNATQEIRACRSCGKTDLNTVLDLGEQPFANSLLDHPEQPEESFPLVMLFCEHCSLVQLRNTADPELLFHHYLWVTGTSSTARQQAYRFRDESLKRIKGGIKKYVLEIASNDGTYLRPFMELGIDVFGVDPAANIVEKSNAEGIPTRCDFFGETVALDIIQERGHPDLVIARNVLAHVSDLHDFGKGIAQLVGDNGLASIEFHYGGKIIDGLQYDSIYHEHLCYITAHSLTTLLDQCGLEVIDIEEGPISGGALIVYARKNASTRSPKVDSYLENEIITGCNDLATWHKFGDDVRRHRQLFIDMLDAELAAGQKIVGYGASARSSTLLNFCGISNNRLPMIADQNPLKHGKFTSGTRIPILPPEEVLATRPDTVVILSWNFLDEIINDLKNKYEFKGKVIVPLPNEPILITIS